VALNVTRKKKPNGLVAGSEPITSTLPPGSTLQQNPNRNQNIADRTQQRVEGLHGQAMWEMNPKKRGRVQDRIDARVDRRIANLEGPGSQIIAPTIVPPGGGDPKVGPGPTVNPPFMPSPGPGPIAGPVPPAPGPGPGPGPVDPGFPGGGGSEPGFPGGGFPPVQNPPNMQIFPTDRDRKNLDPQSFRPAQGAAGAEGIRVGEDPLSQAISGALQGMLGTGGATPFEEGIKTNITNFLADVAGQGGPGGGDTQVGSTLAQIIANAGREGGEGTLPSRAESLREELDRMRNAQTAGLESRLASRGLMGSGFERSGLEGIERELGSIGATQLRDFAADDLERLDARADNRLAQALGAAQQESQFGRGLLEDSLGSRRQSLLGGLQLGVSEADQQAQNLLGTIGAGSDRQQMLTQLAMGALDQNAAFNLALQQAGMDREMAMEQMRQGRITSLQPLLDAALQIPQISQRGFI
jgi:hypothetical protein